MKKNLIFAAFLSLFVMAVSASAQDSISATASASQAKTASFAGTWNLEIAKSTLDDRAKANTESQTLTVAEKDNTITITTATKHPAPPADAPQGGRPGGQGRGGFGGDGTATYTLDGKEVKSEVDGPMGKMPTTMKGKIDGAKLHLEKSSTFTGQMGEVTISTKDVWELSADGKTLTVSRDSVSPRGSSSSKWVYSKSQ